jgi:quinone-modifying oxidoreductase, subunit QmoC
MNVPSIFGRRRPETFFTRFQWEADPAWAEQVAARPGCEGLFSCLQCGTCSGTCPVSAHMDIAPHRVIALVREGFREDALTCQTIWLCASCYACDVECPSQIRLTDIMGFLKREALRSKLHPRRFPTPVLERELCQVVTRRERSPEFWRIFSMALRSNPLQLLTMMRTGWRLIRNRELSPRPQRFKTVRTMQSRPASREPTCVACDRGGPQPYA